MGISWRTSVPLTNVGVGDMVVARFTEEWELYMGKVINLTNQVATVLFIGQLHGTTSWLIWSSQSIFTEVMGSAGEEEGEAVDDNVNKIWLTLIMLIKID